MNVIKFSWLATRSKMTKKTNHLGIDRTLSDRPCIEEKISLGRKTAYSLMGAGFHSGNGLKACLNGFIWSTFVLPRVTYGLKHLY